jgi:hypothetical protein
VVLGASDGVASPLTGLAEPVRLLDIELEPHVVLEREVGADERTIVLVHGGDVTVGDVTIGAHHVAALDGPATRIVLRAGRDGGSLLVLTGRPMGEPVVFGGSFVAVDRSGIAELDQRFRSGAMGRLSATYPTR